MARLKSATNGPSTSPLVVSSDMGSWKAVVLEIVMTLELVYTLYATTIDVKRGSRGTIAPLAVGFILGVNILAGGALGGAALNPAWAFEPALVSQKWRYQWIYWVGPLISGGLVGLLSEWLMVPLEATRDFSEWLMVPLEPLHLVTISFSFDSGVTRITS